MIKIDVKKEGGLEKALKVWKNKFQKNKTHLLLREKLEYTKPSVSKRNKKIKAVYKYSKITF
jgi:small subunit ribosomal protein S21